MDVAATEKMKNKHIEEAILEATEATNYCTKHDLYHGQKYKSCTPQKREVIRIESNSMRDKNTKEAFIKYLEEHPDERFWQALRNWSKYDFILGWEAEEFDFDKLPKGCEDTFYM